MSNKIMEELNSIQIPKELHERTQLGISKAKAEMKPPKNKNFRILPYIAMVACLAIFIPLGLNHIDFHPGNSPSTGTNPSGQKILSPAENSAQNDKKNEETVRTYLKKAFTGPDKELSKILKDWFDMTGDPSALDHYLDKNFKPLFAEDKFENFVNTNLVDGWLYEAYSRGYQLKAKNIKIEKIGNTENMAYDCKVDVEYSKEGKTKTATVTFYINLNHEGKISDIRDINDRDLMSNMQPPPPKKS